MNGLQANVTASTSRSSLTPSSTPTAGSASTSTATGVLRPADSMICSLDQLANPPVGQQPNYPWWTIIRAAIMGSQYGILNREEIYQALQIRWQYFRSTDHQTTRVWKSAIGHNLSVKECFVRVHVEGGRNVSYYIVDTAVDPAKGRLSKAKNASGTDKMPIPTISRKVVLPPNFDLSIRARWSPAIAAIRNAKYGLPCHCSQIPRTNSSDNYQHHSQSDDPSESDDSTETEGGGDQVNSIYPSGSRLGSSLSAIIHPTSPRRPQSIPRLAFSRSLSNALVASPTPPSRRRTLNSLNKNPLSGHQTPVTRPPTSRNLNFSQATRPVIQPLTLASQASPPFNPSHSPESQSPRENSSLQDQVNAALADVAAKLPEIAERPEEPDDQASVIPDFQNSTIFQNLQDDEPRVDHPGENLEEYHPTSTGQETVEEEAGLEDLLQHLIDEATTTEAQQSDHHEQPNEDIENILNQSYLAGADREEENQDEEYSTEAFLEASRLLEKEIEEAVKLAEEEEMLRAKAAMEHEKENSRQITRAAEQVEFEEEAGLEDLLQHLIDEATTTEAQQSDHHEQPNEDIENILNQSYLGGADREEENQDGEYSSETFLEASRLLEKEIEEAVKLAEEQEMLRAKAAMEHENEKSRQITRAAEQVKSNLSPPLTPSGDILVHPSSGDIPVHPLPMIEPTTSSDHQSVMTVPTGGRSKPKATGRSRPAPKEKATKTVDPSSSSLSSHQPQQCNKRPVIRPSLLSCLPEPITTSSTSSLVDRRTRASGARTVGRKLNLPLPSAHTVPTKTYLDSSLGVVVGEGGVDDGSSLAPKFLESIQTVSLNRPNSTFPELAKEALLAHPDGKLTAAEIFKVLEKKYPYFVNAPDSWKATLRNVLTSHSCFVKIPRPIDAPGRGDWWSTVDLPLWKRRRTTAKAKQDEDFIGRYAREQIRKSHKTNSTITTTTTTISTTIGPPITHNNTTNHTIAAAANNSNNNLNLNNLNSNSGCVVALDDTPTQVINNGLIHC